VPVFGGYHFDPAKERETVPLRETIATLGEFIQAGKIRHWGMSNETPWGLMSALRIADELGVPRPVSVQNAYNLMNRTWEDGLSEIGYRENVGLLAYSPLGFGFLSGKYHDDPGARGRATIFSGFAGRYGKANVTAAVAAYVELAREHSLTPTQLALAFVYNRWCVASTIIGATTMEQLREDIAAAETTLTPDVLERIEEIHLLYTNPAP
jgi:aryl-alcohol dehydrogenase-like predicted oxidoreductase